jgi:hypothetical protein
MVPGSEDIIKMRVEWLWYCCLRKKVPVHRMQFQNLRDIHMRASPADWLTLTPLSLPSPNSTTQTTSPFTMAPPNLCRKTTSRTSGLQQRDMISCYYKIAAQIILFFEILSRRLQPLTKVRRLVNADESGRHGLESRSQYFVEPTKWIELSVKRFANHLEKLCFSL